MWSRFIRLRDCKLTTNTLVAGKCVTCGKVYPFEKLQAGHFLHNGNDYDERNIHAQCARCNKWLHGNGTKYYEFMLTTYGMEVIEELEREKRVIHKYTQEQLNEMYKGFKMRAQAIVEGKDYLYEAMVEDQIIQ